MMAEPLPFNAEDPQPLLREIPAGAPYPVDALGPLQEAVEAVQSIKEAPVAIAAQSALSIASLAVQGFADVQTLGGGRAPASLFCLTIAASGSRKSGCDGLLMQGVRDHEADAAKTYREDFAAYQTTHKLWEMTRDRCLREAAGSKPDKATAAKADLEALGPEPEPPLSPNKIASDPTIEGLARLYMAGQPSLGLFSDEGGLFVGGHAMNSDNRLKTLAGLSGFWDGSPTNRTRAGDGAITLRGRRLALHLMTQPVAARPLLSDPVAAQQGFLARCLIAEPPSNIGFRLTRTPPPTAMFAIDRFGQHLLRILETGPPLKEGERQVLAPRLLSLSSSALDLLWEYYCAIERQQAPGGDLAHVTAFASKSAEQATRLAAVQTLWADLDATEIDASAIANGVTLAQHYLGEAKRLVDAASVSLEIERAEMLRRWLLQSWRYDEVTPRDVMQHGPNALRESPVARAAIAVLTKHGWLIALDTGTVVRGASRREAYRIVRPRDVV